MTTAKHTDGPWTLHEYGAGRNSIAGASNKIMPPSFNPSAPKSEWPYSVATVYCASPNSCANARRISAAPELVEALEGLLNAPLLTDKTYDVVRAAQAEGPCRSSQGDERGSMRTVHKFPFEIADVIVIQMPFDAEVLHVECQDGKPCIWALVNENSNEPRKFYLTGTGHPIPSAVVHVATFQQPPFVWHLWERFR